MASCDLASLRHHSPAFILYSFIHFVTTLLRFFFLRLA